MNSDLSQNNEDGSSKLSEGSRPKLILSESGSRGKSTASMA